VALAGGVAGDRPASGRRHTAVVRPDHADVRGVVTRRTGWEAVFPIDKRRRFHVVGSIPMLHTEAQTVHEMLEDQPNDAGGSSCHIFAVWQMRSATASMDARALSPASAPPCEIGKMNRPLVPHCQMAEKSSRLRAS
jgi:hypothetical protein